MAPLVAMMSSGVLMAETFTWTGGGDGGNLFGSGSSPDAYLGNWSPNLTSGSFPVGADFAIDASVGYLDGYSVFLAAPQTIRSLAFTGNYLIGLTVTGSESSTSNALTFDNPVATILSVNGNTETSKVTFAASAPIVLNYTGRATIDVATNATLAMNSVISGTGGIIKTGGGLLDLTLANTFTGGLTINGGRVEVNSMSRLGAAPAAYMADFVVVNGGTLSFVAGTNPITSSGTLRGFQVGSSVGTIEVQGALERQITSIVSDVAGQAGILRKTGTGTLELTRSSSDGNTFTGGLWIEEGTLVVGSVSNLGSSAVLNDSAVIINGGTLVLGNTSYTSYSAANRGFRVGSNVGTISVTTTTGGVPLVRRILGNIGDINGQAGVLRKTGVGVLSLQGNLSYTGGTQVNEGTLRLLSTTLGGVGGAGITVASGATFDGNGSINGNSTLNAGSVLAMTTYITTGTTSSTITSVMGTLAFNGTLDISGAATSAVPSFQFDLGAIGASDLVTATGSIMIGSGALGMSDFSFTAQAGLADGTYTLFSGGSIVGSLLSTNLTGTLAGHDLALALNGNQLQLIVTTSAVPEPATWATIIGAAALVVAVARRSKRSEKTV